MAVIPLTGPDKPSDVRVAGMPTFIELRLTTGVRRHVATGKQRRERNRAVGPEGQDLLDRDRRGDLGKPRSHRRRSSRSTVKRHRPLTVVPKWPRSRGQRPLAHDVDVPLRRLRDASAGYGGVVTDAISAVPGAEHWSYGSFEFDRKTGRRTVPLVRDDGTAAAFTIPEFVSEPGDLQAIAHIVIAACERWENRQGVGG